MCYSREALALHGVSICTEFSWTTLRSQEDIQSLTGSAPAALAGVRSLVEGLSRSRA